MESDRLYYSIDKKATAARIKELRLKAGLSQQKLADKLGFDGPQNICNIEKERSFTSMDKLTEMAEIFHVTFDYLTCQTDENTIDPENRPVTKVDTADVLKAAEVMSVLKGVDVSKTDSGYTVDITGGILKEFLDGYMDANGQSEEDARIFREHACNEVEKMPILDQIDPGKLDKNPGVENIIQESKKSIRKYWIKHSRGTNS